jgi:hypothetical protein
MRSYYLTTVPGRVQSALANMWNMPLGVNTPCVVHGAYLHPYSEEMLVLTVSKSCVRGYPRSSFSILLYFGQGIYT